MTAAVKSRLDMLIVWKVLDCSGLCCGIMSPLPVDYSQCMVYLMRPLIAQPLWMDLKACDCIIINIA